MLNTISNLIQQNNKNKIIKISILLFFVFLFFSCTQNGSKKHDTKTLGLLSSKTLNLWINYYKKTDKDFSLDGFSFISEDTIAFMQGNVFGQFDKEFNPVYLPFLIYNKNKQKYIDIDSYRWLLDEDNEIIFSPDQEIDLVDIKEKTVTRVGFNGPSQWVEDAYWENDSVVVLLKNNYENLPVISKLNINNGVIKSYKYKSSIDNDIYYIEKRITNNIKIEKTEIIN